MKTIDTLRCDLNKTFVNIGFVGAVGLTFLLCFTAPAYTDSTNQKMYSIFEALFSMDRKFVESHSEFAANTLARQGMNGYITLFLPIIVAFPFMVAFCTERNNGNIRFVIARTGKMRYYFSKFVSCFLCGGLAVLIGISLFMCAMHLLFPPMSSYNMDIEIYGGMAQQSEFVLNFRYLFSNFLNGAIATMPAFFLSSFCKNPYIITCIPFMFTYVWETVMSKLVENAIEAMDNSAAERLMPFYPSSAQNMFDERTSVAVTSIVFNTAFVAVFLVGFIVIMSRTRDKGT